MNSLSIFWFSWWNALFCSESYFSQRFLRFRNLIRSGWAVSDYSAVEVSSPSCVVLSDLLHEYIIPLWGSLFLFFITPFSHLFSRCKAGLLIASWTTLVWGRIAKVKIPGFQVKLLGVNSCSKLAVHCWW